MKWRTSWFCWLLLPITVPLAVGIVLLYAALMFFFGGVMMVHYAFTEGI